MRNFAADVYHPKHIVGAAVAEVMAAGRVKCFDELVAEVCRRVPYGKEYVLHVVGKWRDKIEMDLKKIV